MTEEETIAVAEEFIKQTMALGEVKADEILDMLDKHVKNVLGKDLYTAASELASEGENN